MPEQDHQEVFLTHNGQGGSEFTRLKPGESINISRALEYCDGIHLVPLERYYENNLEGHTAVLCVLAALEQQLYAPKISVRKGNDEKQPMLHMEQFSPSIYMENTIYEDGTHSVECPIENGDCIIYDPIGKPVYGLTFSQNEGTWHMELFNGGMLPERLEKRREINRKKIS